MDINIAIIDDDIKFSSNLKSIIIEQINLYSIKDYSIDIYTSQLLLIENLDKYQCVFLDVEMPEGNGLELAKLIRKRINDIYIIFVSSYTNYVFQSFDVQPFTYIVKNSIQTQGKREINRLIKHYYEEKKIYILKIGKVEHLLKQRDIYLIEKQGNDCLFYYKDKILKVRGNFKNLINELADYFALINKSEIINFHFVKNIKKEVIILNNGDEHYISRRKVKVVTENYFLFLKDKS